MTREGDYTLSPKSTGKQKVDDLKARVELAKEYHADLFISIHTNSYPDSAWWGAQVFYLQGRSQSKRLAGLIQQQLLHDLGNSYRWVKTGDFYVLRQSAMPAVLVECGFMSNPREGVLLSDPVHQQKVAWCIYAGVVRYFSGESMPPDPY
jgi:N-acetylmuramoyl-L-alanine amidase